MNTETIAAPEQTSKLADGKSELNGGLGDDKCVIETFKFDVSTQKKLINKFVNDELCPCAIETFNAYGNSTIELTMESLYRAVINEMVLRGLATSAIESPNVELRGAQDD